MKECDRLKTSSVAFPSIGAGNLNFPHDTVAKIMFDTVTNYLEKNRNTSVKKVFFVIFDGNVYKSFQTSQQLPSTTTSGSQGARSSVTYIGQRVGGLSLGSTSDDNDNSCNYDDYPSELDVLRQSQASFTTWQHSTYSLSALLVISVFGKNTATVEQVISEIETVINKEFIREEIEDERIEELPQEKVAELLQSAQNDNVDLEVDRVLKTITVKGEKMKVKEIIHRFDELFSRIDIKKREKTFAREKLQREEEVRQEKARLATLAYCWQFKNPKGEFRNFTPEENLAIEEAKSSGEGDIEFHTQDSGCIKIDFATCRMVFKNGRKTDIRRRAFKEEMQMNEQQLAESENLFVED